MGPDLVRSRRCKIPYHMNMSNQSPQETKTMTSTSGENVNRGGAGARGHKEASNTMIYTHVFNRGRGLGEDHWSNRSKFPLIVDVGTADDYY